MATSMQNAIDNHMEDIERSRVSPRGKRLRLCSTRKDRAKGVLTFQKTDEGSEEDMLTHERCVQH